MRNNRGQPNHTKIIISLTCIPYFKYILYKSGKSTVWGRDRFRWRRRKYNVVGYKYDIYSFICVHTNTHTWRKRRLLATGKGPEEGVKSERQRTSVSIVIIMYENFILKPITIYTY